MWAGVMEVCMVLVFRPEIRRVHNIRTWSALDKRTLSLPNRHKRLPWLKMTAPHQFLGGYPFLKDEAW